MTPFVSGSATKAKLGEMPRSLTWFWNLGAVAVPRREPAGDAGGEVTEPMANGHDEGLGGFEPSGNARRAESCCPTWRRASRGIRRSNVSLALWPFLR